MHCGKFTSWDSGFGLGPRYTGALNTLNILYLASYAGVSVDSGVPDQPFGDIQTLQGCADFPSPQAVCRP